MKYANFPEDKPPSEQMWAKRLDAWLRRNISDWNRFRLRGDYFEPKLSTGHPAERRGDVVYWEFWHTLEDGSVVIRLLLPPIDPLKLHETFVEFLVRIDDLEAWATTGRREPLPVKLFRADVMISRQKDKIAAAPSIEDLELAARDGSWGFRLESRQSGTWKLSKVKEKDEWLKHIRRPLQHPWFQEIEKTEGSLYYKYSGRDSAVLRRL